MTQDNFSEKNFEENIEKLLRLSYEEAKADVHFKEELYERAALALRGNRLSAWHTVIRIGRIAAGIAVIFFAGFVMGSYRPAPRQMETNRSASTVGAGLPTRPPGATDRSSEEQAETHRSAASAGLGDPRGAEPMTEPADEVERRRKIADEYYRSGKYIAALGELRRLSQDFPRDPRAIESLKLSGDIYFNDFDNVESALYYYKEYLSRRVEVKDTKEAQKNMAKENWLFVALLDSERRL